MSFSAQYSVIRSYLLEKDLNINKRETILNKKENYLDNLEVKLNKLEQKNKQLKKHCEDYINKGTTQIKSSISRAKT